MSGCGWGRVSGGSGVGRKWKEGCFLFPQLPLPPGGPLCLSGPSRAGAGPLHWLRQDPSWVSRRGIVTGIYTTSSPEACQYVAHDSCANIIVVDTQKQLEKILKVWGSAEVGLGAPGRVSL